MEHLKDDIFSEDAGASDVTNSLLDNVTLDNLRLQVPIGSTSLRGEFGACIGHRSLVLECIRVRMQAPSIDMVLL